MICVQVVSQPRAYITMLFSAWIMTMQNAKQEALDAIQRLPDDVDIEEMIYRLYVLENVRRGQQDAIEGKSESAENVLKEIQSW